MAGPLLAAVCACVLSLVAQDGDPVERLRAGDWAGALAAAEARLAANPADAVALAVRGRVRLDAPGADPATTADGALEDLERAVAAGVADPATLMALARAHAVLRDRAHDPMVRRAHDLGARERGAQARAAAAAAMAARPEDPFAWKALADVHLAQGEPAEALALFERVLAAPPPDAPPAFLADVRRAAENARVQLASRALAAAIEARDFDAVIRHGFVLMAATPDDPQPCVAVGWARLQAASRLTDAAEALALRRAAADAYAGAVERDVRRRTARGEAVDEACAGLQDAYQLALAFIARGDGKAGSTLLERLCRLLPWGRARARILISLATDWKEAGAWTAAIDDYRAAIEEYGGEPLGEPWDGIFLAKAWGDLALVHRGLMFTVSGPARQAARNAADHAWRRSAWLAPAGDPYAVYARANLARLLASEGDVAGARTLLAEALDFAARRAAPDGTPDAAARVHDTLLLREFLRRLGR